MQKARHQCETETIKLKTAADCVTAHSGVQEGEQKPDVGHLNRKINALKANWGTFEASHESLYSMVSDEDADGVMQVYREQMKIYTLALNKGESLDASLQVAGPTPPGGKCRGRGGIAVVGHTVGKLYWGKLN